MTYFLAFADASRYRLQLRRKRESLFCSFDDGSGGPTAGAAPKPPQCWDCVQRLAMELPAVNENRDQSYEEGLTAGSVLPALSQCSLDDGEIPTLRQIIEVFTDASMNGAAPRT